MDKIIIVDFGSQYTQLIAKKIRKLKVYCEVISCNDLIPFDENIKGVILSGSPYSVTNQDSPRYDINNVCARYPLLGICYGAQLIANYYNGVIEKTGNGEYGSARMKVVSSNNLINIDSTVWMSHGDTIKYLPPMFQIMAETDNSIAMYHIPSSSKKRSPNTIDIIETYPVYGMQFHPEVYQTQYGFEMLHNFLYTECKCSMDWDMGVFIDNAMSDIVKKVGDRRVVMALSGGVDSTVAARLISSVIGDRFHGVFVDTGMLRSNEGDDVVNMYKGLGMNVTKIDAKDLFYSSLEGVYNPEIKRKIIGKLFIDIFKKFIIENCNGGVLLGQGTIYSDVIESNASSSHSVNIKSHHNVGGLPDDMNIELIEPIRSLFKDEVRDLGKHAGIPNYILYRHPFPGPGLAIRILGEISKERISTLQHADNIYISELISHNIYNKVWQAGAILLPVRSVGVMGDERVYGYTIVLRAVTSSDGMTADFAHIPHNILSIISNRIMNEVKGINRVVYDISSKPPATIEWE